MKKNFPLYSVVLHTFLLLTTSTVAWLTLENRDLKLAMQPKQQLVAGTEVGAFPVQNLEGASETLSYDATSQDTLLLVFTSTCPACNENQPNWRTLYEQAKDQYRIIGIGLEDAETLATYRQDKGLPFPVVLPEDYPAFAQDYKLAGVPTTIQVNSKGEVVEAWTGILSPETLANLTDSSLAAWIP